LYAIAPWQDGDPFPPDRAEISYIPLIEYGKTFTKNTMNEFIYGDIIQGGEWVNFGGKSAVVISGVKGRGEVQYIGGYSPTQKNPVLYFYNPVDLEAVVQGTKQPHEPQPYATLNLFNYFYGDMRKVASMALDNTNGYLYVYEFGEESPEIPLIHVWKIRQE
jgi:hypothetical protein